LQREKKLTLSLPDQRSYTYHKNSTARFEDNWTTYLDSIGRCQNTKKTNEERQTDS